MRAAKKYFLKTLQRVQTWNTATERNLRQVLSRFSLELKVLTFRGFAIEGCDKGYSSLAINLHGQQKLSINNRLCFLFSLLVDVLI